MTINETMLDYQQVTQERIKAFMKIYKYAPEGHLHCKRIHGHVRYYRWIKSSQKGEKNKLYYLNKKDESLTNALADKKYSKQMLSTLKHNYELSQYFIDNYIPDDEELISKEFIKKEISITKNVYVSQADIMSKWLAERVNDNGPGFIQKPEISTIRGDYVRSKSEAIIANALHSHGLYYRYEMSLSMNNGEFTYYPDFTILHPLTQEKYIWEHFGMMENARYTIDACKKVINYDMNGYTIGKNFIITMETPGVVASSTQIEHIITVVFLS